MEPAFPLNLKPPPRGISFGVLPQVVQNPYAYPVKQITVKTELLPTEAVPTEIIRETEKITPPTDFNNFSPLPEKEQLSTSPRKGDQPVCFKYIGRENYGGLTPFKKGGFGTIDRTETTINGKNVLSKKIKAVMNDGTLDPYLIRETSITKTVESPLTIKIYDIKIVKNVAELFIPYGGNSLASFINVQINEEQFKKIAFNCFVALGQLSSQGVIHGDIKPDNIVVNEGLPIIIDFGAAVQSQIYPDGSLRPVRGLAGTAQYFSPERARGEVFDNKDDVWAMACTWLLVISPLKSKETNFVIDQLREGRINSLSNPRLSSIIKGDLLNLYQNLFSVDPRSRFNAIQAIGHPYFSNLGPRPVFPVPIIGVRIRNLLIKTTLSPENVTLRAKILTQLLIEAAIGSFSNLIYFLGVKLFDIFSSENLENGLNLEVGITCLCLAAKFYGEIRDGNPISLRTFARRDNQLNYWNLVQLERILYELLCFDVDYSTIYDYLFTLNRLDLVKSARKILRTDLVFKFSDEQLTRALVSNPLSFENVPGFGTLPIDNTNLA